MENDVHRLRLTLSEKRLSHLVDEVQKHIDNCPAVDANCIEELENYKKQIEYMRMYAFGEKKDPYRQQVFDDIVTGLQRLTRDVVKCTRIELSSELRTMKKNSPERDFDLPSIRRNLEDYVSSVAMASLTGADEKDIIEKHFAYIARLFNYIVTGRLWNESKRKFFSEILSSSVIDHNDALVLVSAVTMSDMLVHDELKIETLLDVYTSSVDQDIRHRAFTGWVLGLHAAGGMCERINDRVDELVKNEDVVGDLLGLQMDMFYCASAEKDDKVIKRDIMPGLINNVGMKFNGFGIINNEEDELKNILQGSGDSDRSMEKLERDLDKIKDMELKGSDIYFGGFAKMKNGSFFFPMVNWFYPYISTHPDLRAITDKFKGTNVLNTVDKYPFCDSDKYSFAFVMGSIYDGMPEDIKSAMNMDGADMMFNRDNMMPLNRKRMYIQDLYRFYKINKLAKYMDDPFKEENGLLRGFFFDDYFLCCEETIRAKQTLALFLLRRRPDGEELNLLFDSYESSDTNDVLIRADYLLQRGEKTGVKRALEIYLDVYSKEPECKGVLEGICRSMARLGRYDEACSYYEELMTRGPESKYKLLNYAIILIKCNRTAEASSILFKLNYEYPSDINVMRVLAWCLLKEDKQEKSVEMYDKIMSFGDITSEDNLNAGFARWVSGSEQQAADLFAKYVKAESLHKLTHEIDNEREFLNKHDIIEVDMCMMLDLVEERTKQA